MASHNQPVSYKEIEMVADGINHAIPTQKEMRATIAWLKSMGLVFKDGKKFKISDQGNKLHKQLSNGVGTISGVWKNIEKYFADQGVDNISQINPKNMTTEQTT